MTIYATRRAMYNGRSTRSTVKRHFYDKFGKRSIWFVHPEPPVMQASFWIAFYAHPTTRGDLIKCWTSSNRPTQMWNSQEQWNRTMRNYLRTYYLIAQTTVHSAQFGSISTQKSHTEWAYIHIHNFVSLGVNKNLIRCLTTRTQVIFIAYTIGVELQTVKMATRAN